MDQKNGRLASKYIDSIGNRGMMVLELLDASHKLIQICIIGIRQYRMKCARSRNNMVKNRSQIRMTPRWLTDDQGASR